MIRNVFHVISNISLDILMIGVLSMKHVQENIVIYVMCVGFFITAVNILAWFL